jgi:hypothetical protein
MSDERPTKLVIDCEAGTQTVVPLTDEEIAQRELMRLQAEAEREQREAEEAALLEAKASAQAKLSALGLTESEISALLK